MYEKYLHGTRLRLLLSAYKCEKVVNSNAFVCIYLDRKRSTQFVATYQGLHHQAR